MNRGYRHSLTKRDKDERMKNSIVMSNLIDQHSSVNDSVINDRRQHKDRRQQCTHPLTKASWRGSRQGTRRDNDDDNVGVYVDRYDPSLRYVVIGLLLLCNVDAFFTLTILDRGGEELNPFMELLLGLNQAWFIAIKLLVTAAGLAVLVVHYHFRWLKYFKVQYIIYALLACYVVLVNYEIYLLWRTGVV